jgi:ribosomal-protein-alanine N-acetyltransferase
MEEIKIAKARAIDIKKIIEIEELSYKDPWPREVFMIDYVFNRSAQYFVARVDNKICAFTGLWIEMDKFHIVNIAVHPDYRKRGIATYFMNFIIDYAKEKRTKEIHLEVRKSNTIAQNLYKKLGFEILEELKKYYQDGEDGYRMTKIIETKKRRENDNIRNRDFLR